VLPKTQQNGLPVIYDKQVDELTRLVAFIPSGGGEPELRRALTPAENTEVEARVDALERAIAAYNESERNEVRLVLTLLLNGMRITDESVLEMTMITMSEFPLWAIRRAAQDILASRVDRDERFPVRDPEIAARINKLLEPYWRTLIPLRRLLKGRVK
jgi:hypothetical protein